MHGCALCVPCVSLAEDADDKISWLKTCRCVCMCVCMYVCNFYGCALGVPYAYLEEDADDTLVDDLQVIHAPVHQQ
jgi:hypothetical protein